MTTSRLVTGLAVRVLSAVGVIAFVAGHAHGDLSVRPPFAVAGEPVQVDFVSMGRNGCYRQSGVETEVRGRTIIHRYRVWSEGEMCTQALVDGGFTTQVVPEVPGTYSGEIHVDQRQVASYTLEVFASQSQADAALLRALPGLSEPELMQVVPSIASRGEFEMEQALLRVVQSRIARGPEDPLFDSIVAWLASTPHLEIVRSAAPALRSLAEPGGTADGYSKWKALARVALDQELAEYLEGAGCDPSSGRFAAVHVLTEAPRGSLCPELTQLVRRLGSCRYRQDVFRALLAARDPACRGELTKRLDTAAPDFVVFGALLEYASEPPWRSLIAARAADWKRAASESEHPEAHASLIDRVVAAAGKADSRE